MLERDSMAYGCLFCVTGKESAVVQCIEKNCPGVYAIAAQKEKHKTLHGIKLKVKEILFPGYVFFRSAKDMAPSQCFPKGDIIRILTSDNGDWQLMDRDKAFVQWLFEHNGLLTFSKAYKEGDYIRMISGPLKDMEGQIVRVDKRGRSGQVSFSIHGKNILVWLGFELVDALPQRQ